MSAAVGKLSQTILGINKNQTCLRAWKRGIFFTFNKIITTDTYLWMQQPLDLTLDGITRWFGKAEWDNLKKSQAYDGRKARMVGAEIMAAHFMVARGGRVKFHNRDVWFKMGQDGKMDLPIPSTSKSKLEAVDLSGTKIMHCGFDYFWNLNQVMYVNLSNCEYVDDWCLDKLSCHLRDSLAVLDLSGCHNVSERGLACLHRMERLRRIILKDMKGLAHPQTIAFRLEEALPECMVEGIDYADIARELGTAEGGDSSQLISSWEGEAKKTQNEIANALLNKFDEEEFNKYPNMLK